MPSSVDVTDYSLIPTSAAPVKFSYERRFKLPFDVPIILFLSRGKIQHCICKKKKQGRVHQCGSKVLPGIFMGYALNARRSWIGDLFTADTEDPKTMQPSDIIVKKIDRRRWTPPKKEIMNLYAHAERAKYCKNGSRVPSGLRPQARI